MACNSLFEFVDLNNVCMQPGITVFCFISKCCAGGILVQQE